MTTKGRGGWAARGLCCLVVMWGVFFAARGWAGCEGVPGSCREELLRIERAYRSGLEGARDASERFEAERLRVVALTELVERTYESTLTWEAGREDSTRRFEREQGLWSEGLYAALSGAETAEAMREAGRMLLERLRFFGRMTEDAYCIGEGCH